MERQEKGNMEISGSSIRHRNDIPKAQSSSETNSFNINPTSSARTLQQTQAEADNATSRQPEVFYEGSETNKGEKDNSFEKYWKHVPLPTKAKTDSDGDIGISISSHPTKADSATPQQTKEVKFLEFVKRFCEYLPEVSKPDRKIELKEKVLLTVIVLFIFMMLCQIPLFGIKSLESVDRFYHMRVTRASHRGTPMEFGIMTIAESQFIFLMLTGFKIIDMHDTPANHALLNGAKKLLALLLTVVLSFLFIMTGMYGELEQIGVTFSLLISIQLLIAGLIILLLNDLVKKGYCLGTEVDLFIVANICWTIMWKAFSLVTVYTDQGAEYEGAFIFFMHLLLTKKDKMFVLRRAFLRQNLPNLMNFLVTIVVFVTVIYLKVLSAKFNENFVVNLLGVWAVATILRDKKMVMVGHGEETMLIELDRYISTATVLSGLCLGALSVLADFLGVFGSGTGVILVAIIMYKNAELFFSEQNVKKK